MKKKIIALGLAVVILVGGIVGGTIAYLQDVDSDVNVMEVGNVHIKQHEYERAKDENGNYTILDTTNVNPNYGIAQSYKLQEFTQGKKAYPAVYKNDTHTVAWDDFQQLWNQAGAPGSNDIFDDSVKNVVDKFVFVENTGKSDAYYRTIVAIECPEGLDDANELIHTNFNANSRFDYNVDKDGVQTAADANKFYTVIDGVRYLVYVATYTEVLTPGEVSRPSFLQVYFDPKATNEDCDLFGDTWEILVVSQAVQTEGFDNAAEALETAFGVVDANNNPWNGENAFEFTFVGADDVADLQDAAVNGGEVYFTNDVSAPLTQPTIYGTPAVAIQKGGVIDGCGNKLVVENPAFNGYAIETYGGTIKNLTIDTAVGRGIVISSPTENIYIDNVVVDGPGYAINTTEHNAKELAVTNSTINGWTSLAGLSKVTFTDCSFGENSSKYWQNNGYSQDYDRLIRPYVGGEFTDCEFSKGYYIDLSVLGAERVVTLTDCVVGTTVLTADNYADYITIELPAGRTLADCVVFN